MSLCAIICNIYWKKHNFCDLSPYTAVFELLHVVFLYLKHVFLYFIAVIGVKAKFGLSSLNLCAYLLLLIIWLLILYNCYVNSK